MNTLKTARNVLAGTAVFLFALVLTTGLSYGQDLVLNGNITNNGTIGVNRNVVNNLVGAVAVSGTGIVRFQGATAGTHSVQGGTSVSFTNLDMRGIRVTTLNVNTTVLDQLRVGYPANTYTAAGNGFDISNKTLTLGGAANNGASSYLATSTAALTFSGGTVAFASGSAQSILNNAAGVTYGTLALSNAGAKNFTTGGTVAAATFTQAGGQLSVNENADVTTSTTLADLGAISAARRLRLTAAATGGTITAMNNSSTGTLENAGTGTLTVTTLSGNAGTIDQTGGTTGTSAFTNNITNTGTIRTTSSGTLDFNGTGTQTNAGGTISATGAGFVQFAGDVTTSQGTLSFNSASTVTYDGAGQALATVTYGNLTSAGSAGKTAGANFTVGGNLTLSQNISQTSGALTMTSTTAANVTGTGEVSGAVRRFHNFTTLSNYRFNRANVYLGTATTANTDITLNMTVNTNPSAPLPSTKYIKRNYTVTPTTAGNVETAQLYYATAEVQGSADEIKLGVRSFSSPTWSKFNFASYIRSSGSNIVTLSGLSNALTGVTELGMFQVNFVSLAADLSVAANWDENAFPDNTDDAIINTTSAITGGRALSVATLTVNAGKDLTVNTATFPLTVATSTSVAGTLSLTNADANVAALSVSGAGLLSVSSGRTLTGTSWLNNTSAASTFTGNVSFSSLTNTAGTLNFNGGSSSITGAVSNLGTFSIGGTLSIATSAASTVTSSGDITVNGATGILNVGATTIASILSMTGSSTLTVNNATGQLNVFGDLVLGASTTLSNTGIITVGE